MGLKQDLDDFWPYGARWDALDELVGRAEKDLTPEVVDALLGVFERFSGGADGRGVFLRMSQLVETFDGYQDHLRRSFDRQPSTWVVRTVQRIIGTSATERDEWLEQLKSAMRHAELTTTVRDDLTDILDDHGEEAPTINVPERGTATSMDPSALIGKNTDDDFAKKLFRRLGTRETQYSDSGYAVSFPADGVSVMANYEHQITDVSFFVRSPGYARYRGVLPLGIEVQQTEKLVIDCVGRPPDHESEGHMAWRDGRRIVGIDYTSAGSISLVHVGATPPE